MKQTGSCLKWMEISFFLCVFAFSTSTCHSFLWIKFARGKLRRLNILQTFTETTLIRKFLSLSGQETFIAGLQREDKGRNCSHIFDHVNSAA